MSLYQPPIPEWLLAMDDASVHSLVREAKAKLGREVLILGHHYQRDEVIEHADQTGDSLKLARYGASIKTAANIIFCGVHFMAETADILGTPHQRVSLPDLNAGCDMADMAETRDVKEAWESAEEIGCEGIVPVTYINSKASLKAFVGEKGGTVCTSSNAAKIVAWALERGRHVFFFPDQHLGRNVCKRMGMSPDTDMLLWDPRLPLGGHSPDVVKSRRIWLWKGHCPVHALFTVKQVKELRRSSPEARVIVHPECAMEIVDLADDVGSTEYIIQQVRSGAPGSTWAVGTEKHLVERLAASIPDKKIVSLNPFTCLCGTMNRISLRSLAWVLDDLVKGEGLRNQIRVEEPVKVQARLALERMLDLS